MATCIYNQIMWKAHFIIDYVLDHFLPLYLLPMPSFSNVTDLSRKSSSELDWLNQNTYFETVTTPP